MNRRIMVIQQNVPMCPDCSAMMWSMVHNNQILYICSDCNGIFPLIKNGQAENELVISDRLGDLDE